MSRTTSRETRPTAAASSQVSSALTVTTGGRSPFRALAAGEQQVTMGAGDYNIMRSLAEIGTQEAARRMRERALSAAVNDGRVAQAAVGEWRARYNADPQSTRRELEALPAGSVPFGGTGDEPAATPGASSSSRPASSGSSQVVADGNGGLSYRGFPAALGAAGEPCVFTESGWMSVSSFEASGLSEEDLRAASFAAHMAPGPLARSFADGPDGGSSMRTTFGGR